VDRQRTKKESSMSNKIKSLLSPILMSYSSVDVTDIKYRLSMKHIVSSPCHIQKDKKCRTENDDYIRFDIIDVHFQSFVEC
jgi:hypothetical protein